MPLCLASPRLLALLLVLAVGQPLAAQEGPPAADIEQARAWVAQLGDADYETREEAAEQLRELGTPIAPVLEEGLVIEDIEVRTRCQRLLSEIFVLEREERIEDFIAGRLREDEDELPCWVRVREIIGDDETGRKMYAQMMEHEWDMLETAQEDPQAGYTRMHQRCTEIQQAYRMYQQEIPLGSIAALLLIASRDDQCPQAIGSALYSFCFQNPFAQVITGGGEFKEPLRRLLGSWIENRNDTANPYESLMLAMRYDLPEGLAPASRYLEDDSLPVQVKQLALVAYAKLGTADDMPTIEPFLEDDSVCTTMQIGNERIETQIRDVATVAQIYLWGEQPTDYGFERVTSTGYILFNPATVGFASDEKRQEAYAQWAEYLEEHPTPPETTGERTADPPGPAPATK